MVEPTDLGIDRAHTARMYNLYLGGKDHYEADKMAAEQVIDVFPHIRTAARANRDLMVRYGRELARAGIDQFLDIGTGIPDKPNLHQAVQEVNPAARVVYVDNDPIVLAHARALMVGTREGRTAVVAADLRDPDKILAAPELTGTLDLSKPVAVSLLAVLHFFGDNQRPYEIVNTLKRALAPGSYLALSHTTGDFDPVGTAAAAEVYRTRDIEVRLRTRAEFERFFTGCELVDPGIVVAHRWRPDAGEDHTPDEGVAWLSAYRDARVSLYAGVARIQQGHR